MEVARVVMIPAYLFQQSSDMIYPLQQLENLRRSNTYRDKDEYEKEYIKCLNDLGVNFQQEALILLRVDDPSISTQIWIETRR